MGDALRQGARDVVADPDGGTWIATAFHGQLSFGEESFLSAGGYDLLVAHFDRNGRFVAGRRFGDALDQEGGIRLAATSDGGIIAVGNFRGEVDFGNGVRTGVPDADAFIARYDAYANHLWSETYHGVDDQKVLAVTVDAATGDIVVGGHFNQTMAFPDAVFHADASDGFVARFAPDGQLRWSRAIGGPGIQYVNAVAIDDAGRIVFAGSTTESIDLGTGQQVATGGGDVDGFIAVYDQDASPLWARVYPAPGPQSIKRVAIDTDGAIVMAGELSGSVELGANHVITSSGSFLAKLDPAGVPLFSTDFVNMPDVPSLAIDSLGSVVVGSRFFGQTTTGALTHASAGGEDGLLVKLDPTLAHQWSLSVASSGDDDARAVAVDVDDNVYSLAHFRDTVVLPGCGSFTSVGEADLLLIKHAP